MHRFACKHLKYMLLDPIFAAAFALTCDDYKLMAKTLPIQATRRCQIKFAYQCYIDYDIACHTMSASSPS